MGTITLALNGEKVISAKDRVVPLSVKTQKILVIRGASAEPSLTVHTARRVLHYR